MTTCVLSGRVDESVRDRVAPLLKSAGITAGELIKSLWDYMARTKEVPDLAVKSNTEAAADPFDDFVSYCDALPAVSPWFDGLTREDMRNAIASKYV